MDEQQHPTSTLGDSAAEGGARLEGAGQVNELAALVADLLEATGLVPPDRLAAARGRAGGGSLAQALVDEGLASSDGVARVLAERYRIPFVDIVAERPAPDAIELVPLAVLERAVALPYRLHGNTLHVAIADPGDIGAIDELRLAAARFQLELAVAARDDILAEVTKAARASGAISARSAVEELELVEEEEGDDLEMEDGISDGPLVRLVNSIIFQAAEDGASDIHVEPQEDCLLVRYRIDGVLQEVQRVPKRLSSGVTTRLKVLSKLDIAERRRPQDGRITLNAAAAGRRLDIRVATLPTVEGESVTMRLLDKSRKAPTLEELGMSEDMRAVMRVILARPTGALIVTGPTGSGKSTTLYAALTDINRPEINIITVEDPVEYRLGGVNQIQINQRAGLTFASALRSILRSDPDVVMVGEIRDGDLRRRGRADRSLRALDAAHERRAEHLDPTERDGRRAVPHRLRRVGRARAAPRAQAVRALLRDVRAVRRRAAESARLAGGRRGQRRHHLLPQARLPALQPDRLPRPDRHLPAPDDERGDRVARRAARWARRDRARRDPRRHAVDVGRRPVEGRERPHLGRRASPRRAGLT